MSITVIVAIQGGGSLAAALAALAGQTYPAHLVDVVVVIADDRCLTPAMPVLRPGNCRILRHTGGGLPAARAYGVEQSDGEIVCWLDGDLIADPRHLEAHARWLHAHSTVATIARMWTAGARQAFPEQDRMIRRTRGLHTADHLGFEAFTVPGAAVPRDLYQQVGGLDPTLQEQGRELGYRLWQAGTVLVPEPRATACSTTPREPAHSGAPAPLALAARMPQPRWLRDQRPHGCAPRHRVPLVRAVVPVADTPFERVRDCLDYILDSDEQDLDITAVYPADHSADADWELRLTQAHFMAEPRVTFSTVAPTTAFPSPYLLEVPVDCAVAPHTVTKLVAHADRARAGLVELTVEDHGTVLRLWRTRALCRSLRVRSATESLTEVVTGVHGRRRVRAKPTDLTLLDLSHGPAATGPEAPAEPAVAAGPLGPGAAPLAAPVRLRRGEPVVWWGQARSAMRFSRARKPSS